MDNKQMARDQLLCDYDSYCVSCLMIKCLFDGWDNLPRNVWLPSDRPMKLTKRNYRRSEHFWYVRPESGNNTHLMIYTECLAVSPGPQES